MRDSLPWLMMMLLAAPLAAENPSLPEKPVTPAEEAAPGAAEAVMPWMGLKVGKLGEMMRAHAADVPEGVGFLVESVIEGGPAQESGVRRYDILWKFGDQLLVNEAQLATLLKLRKAGDTVKLSVVRSGRDLDLELVLAVPPEDRELASISPADLPLIPTGVPSLPTVITRPQDRTAEITRSDGSMARLYYKDDDAFVTISGPDEETIYEGPVRKDCEFAVPDEWKSAVGAMLRSLYKAKNPNWAPRRQPRPRMVAPAVRTER